MGLSEDDVLQILKYIDKSDFDELQLEMGDLKLTVRKGGGTQSVQGSKSISTDLSKSINTEKLLPSIKNQGVANNLSVSSEIKVHRIEPDETICLKEEGIIPIKAPIMGIFYRSPSSGAPPFVEVGRFVKEDDTVCLIEVMKTFNSVKVGVRGHIVKILPENAELVEYQQTLFLIKPSEEPHEKV